MIRATAGLDSGVAGDKILHFPYPAGDRFLP
jgi:hypothetical protein